MLNSNHPADERLSALAGHDPEAADDAALVEHVTSCDPCTELIHELGALRASLAELPDLAPPRSLRLLPPVDEAPARAGCPTWVRRLFAPALTAGAALALVGAVGTTGFGIPSPQGAQPEAFQSVSEALASEAAGAGGAAAMEDDDQPRASAGAEIMAGGDDSRASAAPADQLPAQRSPWPMVLFTGVALIVAAALLRWIVVPRAG